MTIPQKAIEAAVWARRKLQTDRYYATRELVSVTYEGNRIWKSSREPTEEEYARAALEAAAPYLMAEAWSQGAQAGFDVTREGFNGECAFAHCADDDYPPTNPYSGDKWSLDDGSVVEA